MDAEKLWIMFGLGAQFLFFLRFFFQWVASEREGKSVVPTHFWYLSVLGGTLLLVYAVHIRDPVFILGQLGGLFFYARNLMLIKKGE